MTVPASIVPAEGKTESREHAAARYIWATTRIGLGFIFLWAFFDKLFGWGIGTLSERSWLNGGSPTTGYLKGVRGPFAEQFNWLAGRSWVDWLFMIGLFAIGVALVAGIGMRIAAASGALLLVFMWMASLPILTNPFLDDHLIYALVIVGLALVHAGDTLGFGRWWSRTALVHRVPVLV
ncbi:MAG: hypothetical protein HYX32_12790 [Actinobacteria bacterium]|nr:hypothetical protein [Actinomycetota bacterium]